MGSSQRLLHEDPVSYASTVPTGGHYADVVPVRARGWSDRFRPGYQGWKWPTCRPGAPVRVVSIRCYMLDHLGPILPSAAVDFDTVKCYAFGEGAGDIGVK